MWDLNLPRLELREGTPEEQRIKSYLFQLADQLSYLFSNVDMENLAPELYAACQSAAVLPAEVSSLRDEMQNEFATLVEQGKGGGWTWRKWKNGRAEMFGNYIANVTAWQGSTPIYYAYTPNIALPFTLKTVDFQAAGCANAPRANWAVPSYTLTTDQHETRALIFQMSVNTTGDIRLWFHLRGTWK